MFVSQTPSSYLKGSQYDLGVIQDMFYVYLNFCVCGIDHTSSLLKIWHTLDLVFRHDNTWQRILLYTYKPLSKKISTKIISLSSFWLTHIAISTADRAFVEQTLVTEIAGSVWRWQISLAACPGGSALPDAPAECLGAWLLACPWQHMFSVLSHRDRQTKAYPESMQVWLAFLFWWVTAFLRHLCPLSVQLGQEQSTVLSSKGPVQETQRQSKRQKSLSVWINRILKSSI